MVSGLPRRAQSAASTAVLVAIIGGFLVLYILFLPPTERERLLFGGDGGGYGGGGGGTGVVYGPSLLMTETPGTLRVQDALEQTHAIPTTTVFTVLQTEEIKSVESGIVQNSVFARRDLEIPFLADRRGMGNFLLSFNVDAAGTGPLRILLNGRQVYERPIAERSPAPFVLSADLLEDGENLLVLQAVDNGVAFWNPNTYELHNILLSAEVLDTRGASSEQIVVLSEDELARFQSASLQFVPDCDPKKAGRLAVLLNSQDVAVIGNRTQEVPRTLYNGIVDCGALFRTDVPKNALVPGENRIIFSSEYGQYVIDHGKLIVRMEEQDYPVYYVNLRKDLHEALELGAVQLRVTMTFTDYRVEKRGEIVVNGFVQSFRTNEYAWQAVIDPGVLMPGPNTVQIIPHTKLDIAELKVELI